MSARGFTVLELLIATALLMVVVGAVAATAVPMRDAVERSLGAADLTGGSRVVLDRLAAEVRDAGSGAAVGGTTVSLAAVMPVIVPLSNLDALDATLPTRAIRVTRVPVNAPQGVLELAAATGATVLQLKTTALCSAVGNGCGLRAGMTAVVYDASHVSVVARPQATLQG